jgi:hypothetical protein
MEQVRLPTGCMARVIVILKNASHLHVYLENGIFFIRRV